MSTSLSLFQEETLTLVDVAIALPVADPFTYQVPAALSRRLQAGCRVRIPFKNRTITGVAVRVGSDGPRERAKKILEILDEEPIVSDHHLRLAKWMSEYYFSSWGEAISSLIPRSVMRSRQDRTPTVGVDNKPHLRDDTNDGSDTTRQKLIRLNQEQACAFDQIKSAIDRQQHSEMFVFGVTGSGKTELYIRAIKEILKRGGSAICLVPEIALTEQLKHFFGGHFHHELEILHSQLTDRERYTAWQKIRQGKRHVILGARSAVFAPVKQLGLIIMDEEQEGSYKQDQSPRYHAREVARWRAHDLSIPFLMGTATPTLETMYRVSIGKVQLLPLTKRVDARPLPEVKVIDLKQAEEISKKSAVISFELRHAIEEALQAKAGILIMLNRRGFSTHIRCTRCHKDFFCPQCAVALTFHQKDQALICHYCNLHMEIPSRCPDCQHPLFKFLGIGTEKVESELARLFPQARIGRLDTDTTRKRGAHEQILSRFRGRDIDILVGTQMIAKGFDFHHVTLVGIISADTGLLLPDFRSSERTFQLLTQMAGRTGRGNEPGRVLVQTYSPHHYSIQYAAKHEYSGFFAEEIARRRALRYPPFTKIINLIFRGKDEPSVHDRSIAFRNLLMSDRNSDETEVLGPAPLPLYRLRGQFRWHLMLRGFEVESMAGWVRTALQGLKRKKDVFLAIDVEPISIL